MPSNEEVKARLRAEGVTDGDLAQMGLMRGPKRGQRFRHYKGGLYRVVCRSVRESDLAQLVTYQNEADGYVWTRTLEEFTSSVKTDSGEVPRFERVEEG